MSKAREEIQRVLNSINQPEAVFTLSMGKRWGSNYLVFDLNEKLTVCDSFIKNEVLYYSNNKINFETGRIEASVADLNILEGKVEQLVGRTVRKFICMYSDSKNPRLTSLYKWYKGFFAGPYVQPGFTQEVREKLNDAMFLTAQHIYSLQGDPMAIRQPAIDSGKANAIIGLLTQLKKQYEV